MRFLVIATLLLSSSAFATTDQGQFFWQAESGKTFLLPQLNYSTISLDIAAATTADIKSTGLAVGVEHGWSEDMSVGGVLTYTKADVEVTGQPTFDKTGLGDLKLYMKGKHGLSAGILRYGADLNLSPGKHEIDAASDENQYSGRHSITPMIGFDIPAGSFTLGGKLSYELAIGKTTTDTAGTETKTEGNTAMTFAFFGETALSSGKIGAALSFADYSDTEDAAGAKTSNSKLTKLDVYGDVGLNEAWTLTWNAAYLKYGSSDAYGEGGDGFGLIAGARYAF